MINFEVLKTNLNFYVMTEPLITNDERLELIELYKVDKLNPPPANIKDETLIKNYGTDEQKARLQPASTNEEQKAGENKDNATETDESKALTYQRELYIELYGTVPDLSFGLDTLTALNLTKQEELKNAPLVPQPNEEYIKEFSRYIDLHVTMPKSDMTLEELKTANDAREVQIKQEAEEAAQIKQNLSTYKSQGAESINLIHKDTKEIIIMPKYTYENFMKKQMPEWSPAPMVPLEIKPPVESIGK